MIAIKMSIFRFISAWPVIIKIFATPDNSSTIISGEQKAYLESYPWLLGWKLQCCNH